MFGDFKLVVQKIQGILKHSVWVYLKIPKIRIWKKLLWKEKVVVTMLGDNPVYSRLYFVST